MAAATAATPPVSPAVTPPPLNDYLYKPYKKYNAMTKRKKHLFLQAGIMPTAAPSVKTVFEVLKTLGDEAPLDAVVLPPDESGNLNKFIAENIAPSGLGFCAPSRRGGFEATGVAGTYAQRNPTKPLNVLLTARRQVANLNSTQAFMTITPPRYSGETHMEIDLLCAKTAPEIDNVGAYLVAFVFLLCRRAGISKIQLSAVKDRVTYYRRLGFNVVRTEGSPLVRMEMDVPVIEPTNLVFEENMNTGFVETYPAVFAGPPAPAIATAATAAFEEEPATNNVFGGKTRVSNKNVMAAKTNNMSAFMRRTRRLRRTRRRP